MSAHIIPRPYLKSCQQHGIYPVKAVERPRYGLPLLQLYQQRFSSRQRELNLFAPEAQFFVPYWDVSQAGKVDQKNLKTEQQLGDWLGDCFQLDPRDTGKDAAMVVEVKPDPQCRYIFLTTASSVAPLEITPAALKRILAYYQVMPCFLDFLYTFGPKNAEERESTRFSGFRTEKTFRNTMPSMDIPALRRSGKRYQLCYTLKSIALKSEDDSSPINKTWRVRSAVFYHQFDIQYGTQLWIIGDPLQGIHDLVQEHIHEKKDQSARFGTPSQAFNTSLEMIVHYCRWASEEWRWHVQSSEEIVEKITQQYVNIQASAENGVRWDRDGLIIVQDREQYLTDTITCLESNIAVMKRLGTFYTALVEDPAWPQADAAAAKWSVKEFVSQLDEYIYDISMQLKRANLALQIAKDRKEILVQHLSAQNAAKQEAYTHIMWRQQRRTGLDAVVMKVITVVTLIYLPMTFVSTFFGTDVVKYQPDSDDTSTSSSSYDNGRVSKTALWQFFAVSVPLMVATFLVAVGWYRWEKNRINKKDQADSKKLEA
ncbi:hypothetical protein OQA88_1248 [Cercophora sp. LCS_1]